MYRALCTRSSYNMNRFICIYRPIRIYIVTCMATSKYLHSSKFNCIEHPKVFTNKYGTPTVLNFSKGSTDNKFTSAETTISPQ